MGNPRRTFGNLREGIWGSRFVSLRFFGDVGEWTWGSLQVRDASSPDWRARRPVVAPYRGGNPKISHKRGPRTRHVLLSFLKALTVGLAANLHILHIHRFLVH